MDIFLIILMYFFIIISNVIGFIYYRKKKSLYFAAFIILLLAVLFGTMGGALAVFIIRDAFAIFYGFQLGQYLIVNSIIDNVILSFLTMVY